eukprot:1203270-Rhodomonas_salina.1
MCVQSTGHNTDPLPKNGGWVGDTRLHRDDTWVIGSDDTPAGGGRCHCQRPTPTYCRWKAGNCRDCDGSESQRQRPDARLEKNGVDRRERPEKGMGCKPERGLEGQVVTVT